MIENSIKTIFLTGVNGYIGNELYNFLKKDPGYKVVPLYRDDLNKLDYLELEKGARFIHLAGIAHQHKDSEKSSLEEYMAVNCDLSVKLYELCEKFELEEFIFMSSMSVFKNIEQANGQPLPISDLECPDNAYGKSKYEAENLLTKSCNSGSLALTILRCPMIYGKNCKGNFAKLDSAAQKKIKLPLKGSNSKRNILYIENLLSAYRAILKKEPIRGATRTYHICDTEAVSINHLYQEIYECRNLSKAGVFYIPTILFLFLGKIGDFFKFKMGLRFPFSSSTFSKLFGSFLLSNDAFCRDFEWSPKFSTLEGVRRSCR